jgi:hypothetical protein
MKARKEVLEELHGSVALELLRRIRSGEALPADIANSIKFLKDNNIEGLATEGSPLGNLVNSMPFPSREGEKMRKPGEKGAPTKANFERAAKTAKYKKKK